MNDNEKVAIVAGLWKPKPCDCEGTRLYKMRCNHNHKTAPNMHDPVNLFQAMTNRWQDLLKMKKMWTDERLLTLVAFECLVDLYNAEHPND